MYSGYVKSLANFVLGCRVLELTPQKITEFIHNTPMHDIFWIYSQMSGLIQVAVGKA